MFNESRKSIEVEDVEKLLVEDGRELKDQLNKVKQLREQLSKVEEVPITLQVILGEVEEDMAKVVKDKIKVEEEKSKVEREKSTVEREKAEVRKEKTMMEEEKTKMKKEKTKMEEEKAKMEEERARVGIVYREQESLVECPVCLSLPREDRAVPCCPKGHFVCSS